MDYAHERTTPPRRNSHSPHTWHMPTRVDRSQKRDFLIPCAACVSRSTTHRRKTRIPPTHYLCQQTHHTPYTTEGNHPPPHALLVTMPPSLSLSHAQHVSVGVPHIAERHVFHPHTTCVSKHTTHHTPQKETTLHPTRCLSPCPLASPYPMRSMCQSEYHTSQKDTYSTHTLLVSANTPHTIHHRRKPPSTPRAACHHAP